MFSAVFRGIWPWESEETALLLSVGLAGGGRALSISWLCGEVPTCNVASAGLCKPTLQPWAGLVVQPLRAGTLLVRRHLLPLCRTPSCVCERGQSHGANPSWSVWVSTLHRELSQPEGTGPVGEERGKGTGKRVCAPGEWHEALPLQSVGSNNFGSCSAAWAAFVCMHPLLLSQAVAPL